MRPGAYLRKVYQEATAGRAVVDQETAGELSRLTREVHKIGTNVNQLVRIAHTDQKARGLFARRKFDPAAVLDQLQELSRIIREAVVGLTPRPKGEGS